MSSINYDLHILAIHNSTNNYITLLRQGGQRSYLLEKDLTGLLIDKESGLSCGSRTDFVNELSSNQKNPMKLYKNIGITCRETLISYIFSRTTLMEMVEDFGYYNYIMVSIKGDYDRPFIDFINGATDIQISHVKYFLSLICGVGYLDIRFTNNEVILFIESGYKLSPIRISSALLTTRFFPDLFSNTDESGLPYSKLQNLSVEIAKLVQKSADERYGHSKYYIGSGYGTDNSALAGNCLFLGNPDFAVIRNYNYNCSGPYSFVFNANVDQFIAYKTFNRTVYDWFMKLHSPELSNTIKLLKKGDD